MREAPPEEGEGVSPHRRGARIDPGNEGSLRRHRVQSWKGLSVAKGLDGRLYTFKGRFRPSTHTIT